MIKVTRRPRKMRRISQQEFDRKMTRWTVIVPLIVSVISSATTFGVALLVTNRPEPSERAREQSTGAFEAGLHQAPPHFPAPKGNREKKKTTARSSTDSAPKSFTELVEKTLEADASRRRLEADLEALERMKKRARSQGAAPSGESQNSSESQRQSMAETLEALQRAEAQIQAELKKLPQSYAVDVAGSGQLVRKKKIFSEATTKKVAPDWSTAVPIPPVFTEHEKPAGRLAGTRGALLLGLLTLSAVFLLLRPLGRRIVRQRFEAGE